MAPKSPPAVTVHSSTFEPSQFLETWSTRSGTEAVCSDQTFRDAIVEVFGLRKDKDKEKEGGDGYVYHAIASVTLVQVQAAIDRVVADPGLRMNWYRQAGGGGEEDYPAPTEADISVYVSIFLPQTSTPKALTTFANNAKKTSSRAAIAAYLQHHRHLPSSSAPEIPKLKTRHVNPYLDFWAWSCQHLLWAGPTAETVKVHQSHPILPIFYHHFGCVCPSYESLALIKHAARGRNVIEIGSGNGYWTLMLRRMGLVVHAVDNAESEWRTTWIGDTIVSDGVQYLQRHQGGVRAVLLMVYPVTGKGYTASILEAYRGDVVCVVGTQNRNGYTGFKDRTIAEYIEKQMGGFERTMQVPLPSFAGKDDALFVFERRKDIEKS